MKLSIYDRICNKFSNAVFNSKYFESIPLWFVTYLLDARIKRGLRRERRLANQESLCFIPFCLFFICIILYVFEWR